MRKIYFVLLLLFAFKFYGSSGCERAIENLPGKISYTTISKGDQAGIQERQQKVIRSKQEYDQMMIQLGSVYTPPPVYPDVDFNRYMVIAVFMGMERSGGFETRVEEVAETVSDVQVIVRDISPGINCMVLDVITYPYHIIRIRKINKPVKFTFIPEVKFCNQ
jgi:hypothetical protein